MSIQGELDRAEKDLFNGNDPSYYDSQAIEDGFVEIDFTLLGGQN